MSGPRKYTVKNVNSFVVMSWLMFRENDSKSLQVSAMAVVGNIRYCSDLWKMESLAANMVTIKRSSALP